MLRAKCIAKTLSKTKSVKVPSCNKKVQHKNQNFSLHPEYQMESTLQYIFNMSKFNDDYKPIHHSVKPIEQQYDTHSTLHVIMRESGWLKDE